MWLVYNLWIEDDKKSAVSEYLYWWGSFQAKSQRDAWWMVDEGDTNYICKDSSMFCHFRQQSFLHPKRFNAWKSLVAAYGEILGDTSICSNKFWIAFFCSPIVAPLFSNFAISRYGFQNCVATIFLVHRRPYIDMSTLKCSMTQVLRSPLLYHALWLRAVGNRFRSTDLLSCL